VYVAHCNGGQLRVLAPSIFLLDPSIAFLDLLLAFFFLLLFFFSFFFAFSFFSFLVWSCFFFFSFVVVIFFSFCLFVRAFWWSCLVSLFFSSSPSWSESPNQTNGPCMWSFRMLVPHQVYCNIGTAILQVLCLTPSLCHPLWIVGVPGVHSQARNCLYVRVCLCC
jgi:hypothetical protein